MLKRVSSPNFPHQTFPLYGMYIHVYVYMYVHMHTFNTHVIYINHILFQQYTYKMINAYLQFTGQVGQYFLHQGSNVGITVSLLFSIFTGYSLSVCCV